MGSTMAVNADWWNEHFAAQARSIGLTEAEAERVLLRSPVGGTCARFEDLLVEISNNDPHRYREIGRLIDIKIRELEELES
jgi:hypothetical protein